LEAILSNSPCTVDDIRAVNLEDPWGRDAMVRILAMLGHSRDSQISREAFAFVASAIARWWDADRERRLAHRHRDFRSEHQYLRRLDLDQATF